MTATNQAALELGESQVTTITKKLVEEDQALADAVRELTYLAIKVSRRLLLYGAPQDQIAVAKFLVGKALGAVGQAGTTEIEEHRDAYMRLFESQHLPPDSDIIEVEPMDEIEATTP